MLNRNVKSNVKRTRVLDLIYNGTQIKDIHTIIGCCESAVYRLIKRMKKDGLLTSDNTLTDAGSLHVKKYLAVSSDVKFNIKPNDIRLHNIQITLKILNKPRGYDYRKNNIISMKVRDYKLTDLKNSYKEQFKINNVTVKTNTDSIEVFPEDIYASTEQQASKRLMEIVFDVISRVENLHHIMLIKDNYCNIRISRQHYALIRNQLAKMYRNEHKGTIFRVYDDEDGKVRLTIDISQGPEFEAEHPSKSPSDINRCQAFFKDIINKDHDMPSDTRSMIQELAQTSSNMLKQQGNIMQQQKQSMKIEKEYAMNIKKHLKATERWEKAANKIISALSQKKLGEFI